jgi:uncharacterized RDD family membrane protein YckC
MDTRSSEHQKKEYAGFWIRFLAYFVDGLILFVISLAVTMALGGSYTAGHTPSFNGTGFSFIIAVMYFLFFWVKQDGQTPGKKVMAIQVVREDGKPIDWTTAIIRYIGTLLSSFLYIGYLMIIWDSRKQGLHDKLAKTLVVKTGEKPKTCLAILLLSLFTIMMIFLMIAVIATGYFIYQGSKNGKLDSSLQKLVPTMTQQESDRLSEDVLGAINTYRTQNNLPPLKRDSRLCAYATRRLDNFTARGGFDNGKGFYEDLNNPEIGDAYFPQNALVSEAFYNVTAVTKPAKIVTSLNSGSNPSGITTDAKTTLGCVESTNKFMEVLGSSE